MRSLSMVSGIYLGVSVSITLSSMCGIFCVGYGRNLEEAEVVMMKAIALPSYANHDHLHILNIMPLRYRFPKKLREQYERYYRAMLREDSTY